MTELRFYGELASWWPLISPVEEYAEEAAEMARVLASAERPVREVLELGSGGGHNAAHLATRFDLTLIDLSEQMLEVSRRRNPGCAHHQGDMRTVRLGRVFDAVLVHDAVDYMTSEEDLRAAMETAHVHCRPGGLALLVPDETVESFEPGADHGGSDDRADGRGVRYLGWPYVARPARGCGLRGGAPRRGDRGGPHAPRPLRGPAAGAVTDAPVDRAGLPHVRARRAWSPG